MNLQLQFVATEYTAQVWPLVEKEIARMVEYGPCDHTLDQMKMQVCTGNWTLLVYIDADDDEKIVGALLVHFQQYPNDRVAFVTAAAGKGFFNKEGYRQLSDYVKARGATRIQSYTRPSMSRLARRCGMTEVATLMDAPI